MRKQISAKAKKIIKISVTVFILLLIASLWAGALIAYNVNFNQRFTSYEAKMLKTSDFEGLKRNQYQFTSNKNQKLTDYLYSSEKSPAGNSDTSAKGIIVFAHGFGGGGHNSYMDCINFFAERGYLVFAYDANGNDESEGLGRKNAVGGLPQGVIDLNYAISFVEESGNFPSLPIYLWGHSWGGYSVVNVLNYHPEVKAVAEIAGFNAGAVMVRVNEKLRELEKLLDAVSSFGECTDTAHCRIMGMGELLCVPIVEEVLLAKQQSVVVLNSRKYIVTTGNQKEGDPDWNSNFLSRVLLFDFCHWHVQGHF